MGQFRCNGAGVTVGKTVAVRERTLLSDRGFFVGTVLYAPKGNALDDVIFIEDEEGLVRSTRRHCVFATEENIAVLIRDVENEIARCNRKKENYKANADRLYHGVWNARKKTCPSCKGSFSIAECLSDTYKEYDNGVGSIEEYVEELKYFLDSLYDIPEYSEEDNFTEEEDVCTKCSKEESITFDKIAEALTKLVEAIKTR
jgi:hypothetical protein